MLWHLNSIDLIWSNFEGVLVTCHMKMSSNKCPQTNHQSKMYFIQNKISSRRSYLILNTKTCRNFQWDLWFTECQNATSDSTTLIMIFKRCYFNPLTLKSEWNVRWWQPFYFRCCLSLSMTLSLKIHFVSLNFWPRYVR